MEYRVSVRQVTSQLTAVVRRHAGPRTRHGDSSGVRRRVGVHPLVSPPAARTESGSISRWRRAPRVWCGSGATLRRERGGGLFEHAGRLGRHGGTSGAIRPPSGSPCGDSSVVHSARLRADWEVYGHWHDDPSKLRTDVYYLVQSVDESTVQYTHPMGIKRTLFFRTSVVNHMDVVWEGSHVTKGWFKKTFRYCWRTPGASVSRGSKEGEDDQLAQHACLSDRMAARVTWRSPPSTCPGTPGRLSAHGAGVPLDAFAGRSWCRASRGIDRGGAPASQESGR